AQDEPPTIAVVGDCGGSSGSGSGISSTSGDSGGGSTRGGDSGGRPTAGTKRTRRRKPSFHHCQTHRPHRSRGSKHCGEQSQIRGDSASGRLHRRRLVVVGASGSGGRGDGATRVYGSDKGGHRAAITDIAIDSAPASDHSGEASAQRNRVGERRRV
ncbi:unnamed protein product, partial [Phaeothamnion confervicola]